MEWKLSEKVLENVFEFHLSNFFKSQQKKMFSHTNRIDDEMQITVFSNHVFWGFSAYPMEQADFTHFCVSTMHGYNNMSYTKICSFE